MLGFSFAFFKPASPDHVIWSCSSFPLPEQVCCLSPCALQKVTAVERDWSLSAVCDLGNAVCDSCELQRMRATGGKALINCKKLAAVNPACKSFKFGTKSCLTIVTRLKTAFSHSHSRSLHWSSDPNSDCACTFCLFLSLLKQKFWNITCLLCLDDKPIELVWLLYSTTIRPK